MKPLCMPTLNPWRIKLWNCALALLCMVSLQTEAKDLRIVTDNNYPPYVFIGANGKAEGYVVDVWKLWEQKTGVKVDFMAMEWSEAQRTILDGRADVIDMIFRTPLREQLYDYSKPYAKLPVGIYIDSLVKGIHDVQSIQGFTIGVQKGDACIDKLTSLGIHNLSAYPNYEAILAAAKAGDIKIFCMDEAPANYYLYLYRDQMRFSKAFDLYEGEFHWAVNRGDKKTFALVSRGMSLITNAEYDALRQKWFKHPIQFIPYVRIVIGIILIALAALSFALAWAWMLRRMVNARTAEIQHKNTQLEKFTNDLQIEKSHLQTIIESSPDAMALKDIDGVYIECNTVQAKLIGLPREQIIGHTDLDFFSDEKFADFIRTQDQKAMQGEQPILYETEVASKDGIIQKVEVIKVPIKPENGKINGVLSIARDISERRRTEHELRLASVAFESHDGIMITNENAIIERINPAFTRISGYSASEAIGRQANLLKSGEHDQKYYEYLWTTLTFNGHWSGEIINRRRDGSLFAARLSITTVYDEHGKPQHYIGHLEDISAEKDARKLAEHLRLYDHLTDLPNLSLFKECVTNALDISSKNQEFGAIIMLDLDLFHKINDSLSHTIGDKYLIETARRLRACTNSKVTACRFSGDSFVLMIENLGDDRQTAASSALAIAENIRLAVAEPTIVDHNRIICTGSLGMTLFHDSGMPPEDLLRQAEIAMYKSKNSGRNTVCFFEDAMQAEIDLRNKMEMALREAIAHNQLAIYYQVQVDSIGRPVGAEALIRWIHPEQGSIPPSLFIPLAEETGLIEQISQFVLTSACKQIALWNMSDDLRHLTLAINISATEFKSELFAQNVLDELERTGATANRIKIEITESLAISDFNSSIAQLETLRAIGLQVSIDDFGTGNSSLNYLTKLPATQLKIDKSFVDNLPSDQRSAMITSTIIAMGIGLDMEVIAEGVETQAQYDLLTTQGCQYFQGYLFGKPQPIKDFEASVRTLISTKRLQ